MQFTLCFLIPVKLPILQNKFDYHTVKKTESKTFGHIYNNKEEKELTSHLNTALHSIRSVA